MTSSNYWGHLFTKKVNFHKYDITCMELCQYYYHFKILLVHYVNTATHMELKQAIWTVVTYPQTDFMFLWNRKRLKLHLENTRS